MRTQRLIKLFVSLALGLVFLAVQLPVLASDCSKALSNHEMLQCTEAAYAQADKQLNRVYRRIISELKRSDGQGGTRIAALRDAQRKWIVERDTTCKRRVEAEWGGGSGAAVANFLCLQELTTKRTGELAGRYGVK